MRIIYKDGLARLYDQDMVAWRLKKYFPKFFHNTEKTTKVIGVFFVLTIMAIPFVFWIYDVENKQNTLITQSEDFTLQLSLHISHQLNNQIDVVRLLQQEWTKEQNISKYYDQARFLSFASNYFDLIHGALGISWINSSGYIKWVYPDVPNNPAINQNVCYDTLGDLNMAFFIANSTLEMGMYHTKELFRGGLGYTVYYPLLYNDTILTGFFALLFRIDEFMAEFLAEHPLMGDYYIKLYENGTQIYQNQENSVFDQRFIFEHDILFFDQSWILRTCPTQAVLKTVLPLSSWPIIVLGGCLSAFAVGTILILVKYTSKLKKVYQDNALMQRKMFQSQKMESLGILAAGIVHDFNNILMTFQGPLDLFRFSLEDADNTKIDPIDVDNLINQMDNGLIRAKALTSRILAFTRQELLDERNFNLHQSLNETLEIFEQTCDRRIETVKSFYPAEFHIRGDINTFHQSLLNILINAKDAMPMGGTITIATSPFREKETDEDSVRIIISDTGKGIPPENIDQIFDPFYTTKDLGKGTGLGLTIVYQTITKMKGAISVESQLNVGTTFCITLPIVSNNTDEINQHWKLNKSPQLSPDKFENVVPIVRTLIPENQIILIIDDEFEIRNSIEIFFQKLQIPIIGTDDPDHFFKIYQKNVHHVFLVILDINLPKKNGMEIYQELRRSRPDLYVLFITGYSEYSIPQDDPYILGILQKPFTMTSIIEKLQNIKRG